MLEIGDTVVSRKFGIAGFVTAIHENRDGMRNGIVRVYVTATDNGQTPQRYGETDIGEVALERELDSLVDVSRRRDGMAYLMIHGGGLACFSKYGRTTRECAPVAWRVAYLCARESGEPMTLGGLNHAMGLVVNEHEDVAYTVREYGHGMYR